MGTPLPEPSPPGDYDNYCWTGGYFHSPAVTPKFLTINVSGVLKGQLWHVPDPEPPEGNFVLPQTTNVKWRYDSTEWAAEVVWHPVSASILFYTGPPIMEWWFLQYGGDCVLSLDNLYDTPGSRHYYGGTIRILGVN